MTANQSAMPPTKPAFAAGLEELGPVGGGQIKGGDGERGHQRQQGGGEGFVAG